MRIGIVTGEYPPMEGGVGAFSTILAQTLNAADHEIGLFTASNAESADTDILLAHNGKNWTFHSLLAIKRWAKIQKLDILNLQFQTAAFQMSPWIHFLPQVLRPLPVVTTFHDLRFPYLFPKAGKLRDWIVLHLAQQSAGVIVTNHEDYDRLSHLPRVRLIPIGSNILTDTPTDFDCHVWRHKAGAAEHDFLLAHFGFMNSSKGVDTLLHAVFQLRTQAIPVKLLMIGGRVGASDTTNAKYADQIDALILDLNLTDCITWTGYVSENEVSAFLRAADVVTLPFLDGASYRRGSLMAAIHHGCAIISTQPQVAISQFEPEKNMLLIPPNNPEALTEAVLALYQSSALQSKLREGALALRAEFDWKVIAANTADFFQHILQSKSI